MTLQQLSVSLGQAISTFDQNYANAGILRSLAKDAPVLFLSSGLKTLLGSTETPGFRYLTVLLLKMPNLFTVLCDPWKYTQGQAIDLSTRLIKTDSSFDIRLAQRLPGRHGAVNPDTLKGEAAERALDILDEVSMGRRVIPILNHLTSHPDRNISSKAALLLGKRVQNVAWAKRILTEGTDARLRANAIESVWGSSAPDVTELFRDCLGDRHNRVVGNSIVGLHLAGDPEVPTIVAKFAEAFEPEFRMTAAWAMGKLADSSFAPTLTTLLKDDNPSVRRAALRSLHGLRQLGKNEEQKPEAALPALR